MSRRTLLIAGAAAVAVLSLRTLLQAWAWRDRLRLEAAVRLDDLARVRRSIAGLEPTRDSFQVRARRFVDLAPWLIEGESPAEAESALASLISLAADRAETVRLGAVQLRADTGETRLFTHLVASGDLTGDVHGIMRFLARIEGEPPLLALRWLVIEQPDPGAGKETAEALTVRFVIEGLALTTRARSGS